MIANYHTHTWRCRHADGTEREYVEKAIEAGLKILGFSDHTPQVYPNGFVCPVKMLPVELEGYVDTILDLKLEYKNDIEINLDIIGKRNIIENINKTEIIILDEEVLLIDHL